MVQAGWPPTQAAAVMLVTSSGPMALARGVRNHSPTFAASSYALSEALWARARAIRSPAPPAFASLRGTFGLVSADECWLQLLADDAAPGRTSFTTTAVVLASSDPATFPDEESVSAQRPPRHAPDPRLTASPPPPQVRVPLQRLGSVACELTDGPVVCFESSNDGCLLRSLIQTSPTGFALPPLARVTLVDVRGPGEWASPDGKAVSRTCFVCRVCYPY